MAGSDISPVFSRMSGSEKKTEVVFFKRCLRLGEEKIRKKSFAKFGTY
jgi:hypothetical protein